jgi:hypothetical protein
MFRLLNVHLQGDLIARGYIIPVHYSAVCNIKMYKTATIKYNRLETMVTEMLIAQSFLFF